MSIRSFAYFILLSVLIIVFYAPVHAAGYIEWLFPGAYIIQPYDYDSSNFLEFRTGYNDLLREHLKINQQNSLQSGYIYFDCNLPAKFTNIEDSWGVSLKKTNLDYNYSTTPAQQSALKSDAWQAELSYSFKSKFFHSALSFGGGIRNDNKFLWNIKVKTSPFDFIEFSYSHHTDFKQLQIAYDYEAEKILFPLDFSTSADLYTIKFSPRKWIYWENSWQISWMDKYFDADDASQIDPSVKYQRISSMMYLPFSKYLLIGAGWNEYSIYGDARLLEEGVSFGKITDIEANFKGPLVKAEFNLPEGRGMEIEFEYIKADGKTRGHLEFWPFTPTLVDLIGYRRYFYGWINAEGYRYSFSTDFRLFRKINVNPVINFIDLFTDGEFSTWQPEWLVFGVTDEMVSRLKIRRFQAALVNLNISVPINWGMISYAFTQWIPLKTYERTSDQMPGDTSGPGYPEMKAESSTGGRMHQLSLIFNLDIFYWH